MLNLQEENESLKKHIVLSESKPVNTQEIDNLLDRLTSKYKFDIDKLWCEIRMSNRMNGLR